MSEDNKLFPGLRKKLSYLNALRTFAEGAVGQKLKQEMETYTTDLQRMYVEKLTNSKSEEQFDRLKREVLDVRNRRAGILEAAAFLDVTNITKRMGEVEEALQEDREEDEYATNVSTEI